MLSSMPPTTTPRLSPSAMRLSPLGSTQRVRREYAGHLDLAYGATPQSFVMRGHRRHDRFRGSLSAFEGRGGQNATHDHARVHVPRLRLKAELDGDAVLARLVEQVVEFAESLDGKRAGRLQEHLEDARPVAPDKADQHAMLSCDLPLPVEFAESPRRSNAPRSLSFPGYDKMPGVHLVERQNDSARDV